jgi:glycosyltransferase involved in cell wall biosynthesis
MGKGIANLKKTIYYLKRNGLKRTFLAVAERLGAAEETAYQPPCLSKEAWERQRAHALEGFSAQKFSIVVPAYRTPERYLRELIESVCNQTYPNWELILADASGDESVKQVAGTYEDERIRYVRLAQNKGIAENTNEGLAAASGDYVGLLDHDDLLTPDALYEMALRIEQAKAEGRILQMLYSDEDKCDGEAKTFSEPHFKEDFNLDLLLSNNYICHFLVMKRELICALKLRGAYNGAQDFDLVLRAAAHLTGNEAAICHVPLVLYHWRCHNLSTAENPQSKLYAYEAGLRAVEDFACKMGWNVCVEHMEHLGFYKVTYREDVFQMRPEIGAIGGPVLHQGKVVGGRMDEDGQVLYQGLRATYGGYMHRAKLPQQAKALDIRNLRLSEAVCEKHPEWKTLADDAKHLSKEEVIARSLQLSKMLREEGYLLLYMP